MDFLSIAKAIILASGGLFIARFLSKAVNRLVVSYATAQQSMLLQKTIYLTVLTVFIVAALQQLGFKLSVILGSAGIITAAVAIASQTSVSNIISGIFLIIEKPFQLGDEIKVGTTTGRVSSVDLLSVKIITENHTLIRVPNETLIKSEITNMTRFENRRVDIPLKVKNLQEPERIKKALMIAIKATPEALSSPAPTISIQGIDSTGLSLILLIWVKQEDYPQLMDSLFEQITLELHQNQIEL